MSGSPADDGRGASELIGVVLLFAFVFAAATFTFYFGLQASSSIQEQTELDTAERNMEEVKNRLATVAASNGNDATEIALDSAAAEDARIVSDGRIVFQVNDHSDCVASMEMGSIVYENDRGQVAYQAGGVWRQTESGSTMVSPPGLDYGVEVANGQRLRTITFPMVNVNGDLDDTGETVEARRNATMSQDAQRQLEEAMCMRGANTSRISEDGSLDIDNVTIRVENSTYYEAWGRYLEDEFGDHAEVDVYDGNRTVVVRQAPLGLIVEPAEEEAPDQPYQSALFSTGNAGSDTTLKHTDVDSFDSDEGPYSASQSGDGKFVVDGNVVVETQVSIDGDVIVDGDVDLDSSAAPDSVDGDLVHNGTVTGDSDTVVSGDVYDNASIDGAEPVTDRVTAVVDHVSAGNHTNWRTPAIEGDAVNSSGGEIGPGQYYVDDFRVDDGQTVTVNTTGDGLVVIAVGGDFEVTDESSLRVIGDGQVVFYVMDGISVSNGGNVTVEDDQTWRNWLYCTESCDVAMEGPNSGAVPDSTFSGVVYAPTDGTTGSMTVDGSIDVYGALVGGELTFDGAAGDKPNFHFDEALLSTNPPEVTLGTTGDGPGGDGSDAIGGGGGDDNSSSPDGTLQTSENVTVGNTTWELESFDVVVELRGSELTGVTPGDDLTFAPVEFDLLTDGSTTDTDYFPNEDPPGNAAREDDAAWPSLFYNGSDREAQTARLENLSGGTSFSVAATSYYCSDGNPYTDDFDDTGIDRTAEDGTTYDLEGCTGGASENININASLGANNGNLKILRDGDYLPNVDGAVAGQLNYTQMLGEDRINDSGYLTLDDNEVVFLFELSEENATFDADEDGLNCDNYQCDAYYPLNESSGNVANEVTGNVADGAVRDDTTLGADGLFGTTAYEFDGNDDRVDIGAGPNTVSENLSDGQFTINMWVDPTYSNSVDTVLDVKRPFSDTHPLRVIVYQEGAYLRDSDGSYYYIGDVDDGYHQITVTYDGSTVTAYVDGEEGASYEVDEDFEVDDRVTIGAEVGGDQEYEGRIDEVRVFDDALSDQDIGDTGRDAFFDGDPDYNDAVMLYKFEDFEWRCVDNCSSPSEDDSGGGGTDLDSDVDNDVREDDEPSGNDFVIRITNSQVVVEDDEDDDS